MSAHLHTVVILYIISMQIINLQSTTHICIRIYFVAPCIFSTNQKSFKSHLYINLRRLRDVFVPSFVCLLPSLQFALASFMLTVHINAFYNECVHGREEHAT